MDKRFDRLPKEMLEAMAVLQELHAAPDSMALQVILGTVNLAAQAHYNVDSGIYHHRPISLFLMGLAPTGALKSTLTREARAGIDRFVDQLRSRLENDVIRYKLEEKKFKAAEAQYLKDMDAGGNFLPPALPTPPKPVQGYDCMISKATLNGIIEVLKCQSWTGLFSSEAGEFFSGHAFKGREANNGLEMITFLTKLWDGDTVDKITGLENTKLWNRRLMMLFLLQTETVQEVLNNKLFSDQGFIHRILITQTDQYAKPAWDVDKENFLEDLDVIRQYMEPFHQKVFDLCNRPIRIRENSHFELNPITIKMSPTAFRILGHWRNANRNRGSEDLKNYAGFAERLHEHALRIAATLAAFENWDTIQDNHARAAIDLMDYYCEQRLQMEVGVVNTDPIATEGVRRLYDWIRQNNWSGTKRELSQRGPKWYRDLGIDQKNRILENIVKSDLVIPRETRNSNNVPVILLEMASVDNTGSTLQ